MAWLVVQMIALLIPAMGWKYAASEKFPDPPEQMAGQVMAIIQLIASSLLFPYLLRNTATAVMVIVASWPMTVLSAFLGGQLRNLPIVELASYMTGWLVSLWLLRTALRNRAAEMTGVTLAAGWVIGAAALTYLHAEFGTAGPAGRLAQLWENSPLSELIPLTRFRGHQWRTPWVLIGTLAIAILVALVAKGIRRPKSRVDKSPATYPQ